MRDRFGKLFPLSNCAVRAAFLVVCVSFCVVFGTSRATFAQGLNLPVPGLGQSAVQTLKAYNLPYRPTSTQIDEILARVEADPSRDLISAYIEAAYAEARRQETFRPKRALGCYASVALYAWRVLFDSSLASQRDASIFSASELDVLKLYNGACERLLYLVLRDVSQNEVLTFRNGQTIELRCEPKNLVLKNIAQFSGWTPEELGAFQLASSVKVDRINYVRRRNGIGVPLVAYRKADPAKARPEEAYYPEEIRFPATAILRPNPAAPLGSLPPLDPNAKGREFSESEPIAYLEIYESLETSALKIDDREVPLGADLTTPLASFLSANINQISHVAKQGLFKPEELLQTTLNPSTTVERSLQGLYMAEPYDPNKIPVVMIHGLGSTPITWIEMYNALSGAREIRRSFQFWFFFYPTGQPFWISAEQFRTDWAKLRETVDPSRSASALDQTVLIGHSMGGLISRMQVQSSGSRVWERASSKSLDELELDADTKAKLRSWFFFEPNPSIKRVITIATPFKGSYYANDFTQWIAGQTIVTPQVVSKISSLFTNPTNGSNAPNLLQTTTSVDALAPNSPIFAALEECPIPTDVALNNIVGVLNSADKRLIAPKKTDGVVEFSSSHRDDVESEKIVSESHGYVHAHPAAILEVKEILLRHRDKARDAKAKGGAPSGASSNSNGFGSAGNSALPVAPDVAVGPVISNVPNASKSANKSAATPQPPVVSDGEPARDETLKGSKPPYVFPEY